MYQSSSWTCINKITTDLWQYAYRPYNSKENWSYKAVLSFTTTLILQFDYIYLNYTIFVLNLIFWVFHTLKIFLQLQIYFFASINYYKYILASNHHRLFRKVNIFFFTWVFCKSTIGNKIILFGLSESSDILYPKAQADPLSLLVELILGPNHEGIWVWINNGPNNLMVKPPRTNPCLGYRILLSGMICVWN